MTRIEWLLKGDPLYSLTSTRLISFRIPRQSETTKERSGPGAVPVEGFRGLVDPYPFRINPDDVPRHLQMPQVPFR